VDHIEESFAEMPEGREFRRLRSAP